MHPQAVHRLEAESVTKVPTMALSAQFDSQWSVEQSVRSSAPRSTLQSDRVPSTRLLLDVETRLETLTCCSCLYGSRSSLARRKDDPTYNVSVAAEWLARGVTRIRLISGVCESEAMQEARLDSRRSSSREPKSSQTPVRAELVAARAENRSARPQSHRFLRERSTRDAAGDDLQQQHEPSARTFRAFSDSSCGLHAKFECNRLASCCWHVDAAWLGYDAQQNVVSATHSHTQHDGHRQPGGDQFVTSGADDNTDTLRAPYVHV
ncbi:hypothetical protein DOTSEDRAFT_33912 [Dothistroma septosporum NZE10]|uniref:Uncharacterized protein n=1 Tax=Dothistroma septosporum (strain NZE10 / CBS 128990) TaxID=675120 RepID=N1PSQ4_DOTSN|nr:hypothetical protein DOTSEDRAFT_33912 [Dothistroma septosporum NZE10]